MALDFTGISNENEFYTSHYLAAILEDDLKDLFATWAKAEEAGKGKPPADRLLALSRDYARFRSDFARERDPEGRLELQRRFITSFLAALGYHVNPTVKELAEGAIPILAEVTKRNGAPELWVLETVETSVEEAGATDPLALSFLPEQLPLPESGAEPWSLPSEEGGPLGLDDVLTKEVFALPEPPRWVLVLNHGLVVLADRTKWNQKRFLRFDLAELYGRRNPGTFRALAALLHHDSLAPEGGLSLLDTLDESSHKHAFAVSDDLKYSVREAVELLGNEALYDLRERLREGVYGKDMEKPLTEECLRYLYRLLFCFYVEARPELGYAPMKSEEYRTGYSLEALRDLELTDLTTEESKNGFFLNDSISTLFRLVYEGFAHGERQALLTATSEGTDHHTFRMEPLRSHLFDPERTPTLNRVRFRNHVLQNVLECLSLSRPRRGRGSRAGRRGRISYAQLGINQLGAVYEGLLSYTGFFAEEDLYEVHRAGDDYDELENAYFVKAADLPKYTDEEKLFDGRPKKYPKGTFIYRLAGRNREKSASYYTPEVLTRCVVKYALKELLKDRPADDILSLTICEPALGSGAFANEAVNQLAEAYLERKQRETGRSIPHDELLLEKQKVKAYLADNNVHGVDLNPIAVELAEISLWLNTIYAGHTIPWFGNQLVAGNSLVGARRQVFQPQPAPRKRNHFVFEGVPDRVRLGETRPEGAVYHFLAPDAGMCDYGDRVIRELVPAEINAIKEWKKEFGQPFSESELTTLRRLSAAIDRLWQKHVEERRKLRALTRITFPIFGHEVDPTFAPPPPERRLSTRDKDRLYRQHFLAEGVRASSPYRRLKTAMDYWCALWFWPIEKASLLPSREEFLLDLTVLLEGTSQGVALVGGADQTTLFPDDTPRQEALRLIDEFGFVDVDKLTREMPRLATVKELAERHRFLHWELEFAEVFANQGGFDLIVGNPPWIKVEWNEGGVMGDFEPLFVLRGHSAAVLARLRTEAMAAHLELRSAILTEFADSISLQRFLSAEQWFPLLAGSPTNLYKCFILASSYVRAEGAVEGFLHPEGVFEDPRAGQLRQFIYRQLVFHFQFQNEWPLFPDIGNRERFAVCIYGEAKQPSFLHCSNLVHPSTIDACFAADDDRSPEGIKSEEGEWSLAGHSHRLVKVTIDVLKTFSALLEDESTEPESARLAAVHVTDLLPVLEKLAAVNRKLGDLGGDVAWSMMWNETTAQLTGVIARETKFPVRTSDLILSGPHIGIANPLHQTPRSICDSHRAYDRLDLLQVPENYLPRSNYRRVLSERAYREQIPTVGWNNRTRHDEYYRLICRTMLSRSGERTLIGAVFPPNVAHIDTAFSMAFRETSMLATVAAAVSSLPLDFFVKSTGQGHLRADLARRLPIPLELGRPAAIVRVALLSALTTNYVALWDELWNESFNGDDWTKHDPRLPRSRFSTLGQRWSPDLAMRSDFERRQALLELDVLVSRALGLTLADLCALYRIQFPVLQETERDTWYDRTGRIAFTSSKGQPGVGFDRAGWNEIKKMTSGTVTRTILDDTLPGGPREWTITYVAPFDRCDREEDYRVAWAEFERRGRSGEVL